MDLPFHIWRDVTLAFVLSDYVAWASRQGGIDYEIPKELKTAMKEECRRISAMMTKG